MNLRAGKSRKVHIKLGRINKSQRVDKLVLVAPDRFASPGFTFGKAPEVPAALSLMRWTLPPWMLRMNLTPAYAQPKALEDLSLTRYHELMRAPGARQALRARLRQIVLVHPVPQLQQMMARTLLVWGRDDAMIPFGDAADYQRAMARTTLMTLDAMGHLPMEEKPAQALPAVLQFLSKKDDE